MLVVAIVSPTSSLLERQHPRILCGQDNKFAIAVRIASSTAASSSSLDSALAMILPEGRRFRIALAKKEKQEIGKRVPASEGGISHKYGLAGSLPWVLSLLLQRAGESLAK